MCWEGLQRLGFRRQRYTRVKSVSEAAAGADLTDEAVKARQASAGSAPFGYPPRITSVPF